MGRARAASVAGLSALVLGVGWLLGGDQGSGAGEPLAQPGAAVVPADGAAPHRASSALADAAVHPQPLAMPADGHVVDRVLGESPTLVAAAEGVVVEWSRDVRSCESAGVTTRVTVFADGRLERHVERAGEEAQLVVTRQLGHGELDRLLRDLHATGVLAWSGRLPDALLDSDDGSHSVTALTVRLEGRRVAVDGRDVAARSARLRASRPEVGALAGVAGAGSMTEPGVAGLPMTDCVGIEPPRSPTPGRLLALADAEALVWRWAQAAP